MATRTPTTFDEINITPLTDIFLVLLIIMMVVAPMVSQQRADIKTPKVQAGTTLEPNRLTVEVDKAGVFYVDGAAIVEAELANTLKTQAPKYQEKTVVIRADGATRSKAVLAVMDAARDAGMTKVTLAGEPEAPPADQSPASSSTSSSLPTQQPVEALPANGQ